MMRLRAFAQLVRLPNLPSALADVCLGALAIYAHSTDATGSFPYLSFALLLLTTACLYSAGMVWNDYFDLDQDKRERPFRPIASGQVSKREAAALASVLMAVALVCAWIAGESSFIVACLLVGAILLYDRWLKRDWAGPLGMGACRFLNVILGLSLAGSVTAAWHLHLAAVVGAYVVGLTWFARTEATLSNRSSLQGASLIILGSLFLALLLPVQRSPGTSSVLFPYLLVAFGFLLVIPMWRAIESPTPQRVQSAVKRMLVGIIVLDAVLATALAGIIGLMILLLLLPSLLLARHRWLYAT